MTDRWERLRKLLRLLVGRRKRCTLSEDLATSVSQPLSSGAQVNFYLSHSVENGPFRRRQEELQNLLSLPSQPDMPLSHHLPTSSPLSTSSASQRLPPGEIVIAQFLTCCFSSAIFLCLSVRIFFSIIIRLQVGFCVVRFPIPHRQLGNLTRFCGFPSLKFNHFSRERLMPQVEELLVFDRPMPLDKLALPRVPREPGLSLESQLASNGLAEQRWRAGSSQCLANLKSWPSRLSLVE